MPARRGRPTPGASGWACGGSPRTIPIFPRSRRRLRASRSRSPSSRAARTNSCTRCGAAGSTPGDTIAYDLPNGVDIVVWQLATQESGPAVDRAQPELVGRRDPRILEHSGATGLVLHHRFADRAEEATTFAPAAAAARGGRRHRRLRAAGSVGRRSSDHRARRSPARRVRSATRRARPAIRRRSSGRLPDLDPWAVADSIKSFGHAFRFLPLHGRAPRVGRNAPRRLPGLLPRRAQRRAGARDPGQVRPRGSAAPHRASTT